MASLIALIRADAVLDVPVLPGAWDVVAEDNRWASVYPVGRGGAFFRARLMLRQSSNPTRAAFVCTGAAAVLDRLATQIAADALPWTQTWATLAALRADNGAIATAVKAAWPDERPLVNTGTAQSPVWTPTGTLVALYARMAGFDALDGES